MYSKICINDSPLGDEEINVFVFGWCILQFKLLFNPVAEREHFIWGHERGAEDFGSRKSKRMIINIKNSSSVS